MSRSKDDGVVLALGAVAAVGLGASLSQKRGSNSTFGIQKYEKGRWDYAFAYEYFRKVKDPAKGRPLTGYYKRLYAGPGWGTKKGPEYFSFYLYGEEVVRVNRPKGKDWWRADPSTTTWELFPAAPGANNSHRYFVNKYSPVYVRRVGGTDFVAEGREPPKTPASYERVGVYPNAQWRRVPGKTNRDVVEYPFLSKTVVNGSGEILHQDPYSQVPGKNRRKQVRDSLDSLLNKLWSNDQLGQAGFFTPTATRWGRHDYEIQSPRLDDELLDAFNLKVSDDDYSYEFLSDSFPGCPQCEKGASSTFSKLSEEDAGRLLKELAWGRFSARTIQLAVCYQFYQVAKNGWASLPEDKLNKSWSQLPELFRTPSRGYSRIWYSTLGSRLSRELTERIVPVRYRGSGPRTLKEWGEICSTVDALFSDNLKRLLPWLEFAEYAQGTYMRVNPYNTSDPGAESGRTTEQIMGRGWAQNYGSTPPIVGDSNWLRPRLNLQIYRLAQDNQDQLEQYMWRRGIPTQSIRMMKKRK